MPQSAQSPTRTSLQKAAAKPSTSPSNNHASAGTDLASVSVTSAPAQVEVDEPILFAPCFHSLEEEDLEAELLQTVEAASALKSQVAQIFGVGLGYASEVEVARHGEIALPEVTPEAILAPILEPTSVVVERWGPRANPTIESDVAIAVKSKDETDEFEAVPLDHQNQIACMASTVIGKPSLSLASKPGQPTSVARSAVPRQPPSSADFEFVTLYARARFVLSLLCIHKQTRRQCAVKIVSNAVLEDQKTVRTLLAEQRIMREVSRYPFLLGLLASFRGVHGIYLVTVS